MGDTKEADRIRPIPKIKLDAIDEKCIRMMMIGSFLTSYNIGRFSYDAIKAMAEKFEDLDSDGVRTLLGIGNPLVFPKVGLAKSLYEKVK
jgi:hypothetical protein